MLRAILVQHPTTYEETFDYPVFLDNFLVGKGQTITDFADSIRIKYKIPELAFAVVSADTVFEIYTLGVQRINSAIKAKTTDRFHIGSNTKAITSFISALFVEQGEIKWNIKFFDLLNTTC